MDDVQRALDVLASAEECGRRYGVMWCRKAEGAAHPCPYETEWPPPQPHAHGRERCTCCPDCTRRCDEEAYARQQRSRDE